MKKFLLLFLLLIPFSVKGIVKPTKEFYVNDYGNVLSKETEEYILDRSIALNKVDGTQIVVVTIKDLEGESIEDYAYKYFNDNGIGDKNKKNGLLILISVKDRKSRIEVGDGLEGILPDGKTGRFQDQYMIPYLRDNKYDEGIKNGYNAFHSEIVKLNHLDLDYKSPKEMEEDPIDKLVPFIIVAVLGGAIMGGLFRDGIRLIPILVSSGVIALPFIFKNFLLITIIYFIFFIVGFFSEFINGNFGWLSSSGSYGGGGFSGGGGSSSGGGSSRGF